jgi:hypothetical protein
MSMWEPLKSVVDRMPAEGEDLSQVLTGPPCRTCRKWQPRVEYMDLTIKGRRERTLEGVRCCVSVDMYHDFTCYEPLEVMAEEPKPLAHVIGVHCDACDQEKKQEAPKPAEVMEKPSHSATCQTTGVCAACSREVREEREASKGTEQFQSFAHDPGVMQVGDDVCRRCGARGWKIDEFTSPYSGLCKSCDTEVRAALEQAQRIPRVSQEVVRDDRPLPETVVQPQPKGPYETFLWCGQTRYRCNKLWPQSKTPCGFDTHDELVMFEHIRSVHKTPKPAAALMMPTLFDAGGQEIRKVDATTHGDEEPQFKYVFADEKKR